MESAAENLDALAAAARSGDCEAFRSIVLATQAELRLAIAARLRVPDLIEEVLQRSYIAAWEALAAGGAGA